MKTQLDIYKSAQAAAESAIGTVCKTQHEADTLALKAFDAGDNDPLDWPQWKAFFQSEMAKLRQLKASRAMSEPHPKPVQPAPKAPAPAAKPITATAPAQDSKP